MILELIILALIFGLGVMVGTKYHKRISQTKLYKKIIKQISED